MQIASPGHRESPLTPSKRRLIFASPTGADCPGPRTTSRLTGVGVDGVWEQAVIVRQHKNTETNRMRSISADLVPTKSNGENDVSPSQLARMSFFVFGFQNAVVSSIVSLSSQPSRDGSQLAVPGRLLFFRVKGLRASLVVQGSKFSVQGSGFMVLAFDPACYYP